MEMALANHVINERMSFTKYDSPLKARIMAFAYFAENPDLTAQKIGKGTLAREEDLILIKSVQLRRRVLPQPIYRLLKIILQSIQ